MWKKDRHSCLNEGTHASGLNQTQSSPNGKKKKKKKTRKFRCDIGLYIIAVAQTVEHGSWV